MSDTIDLAELAESFRTVLAAEWPREKAVAYAAGEQSIAGALWEQCAALGWMALTVPEDFGGLGMGHEAAAALHQALGAAAAPLPLLGHTLAIELLVQAGSPDDCALLLPGFAAGTHRGAVAAPGAVPVEVGNVAVAGRIADLADGGSATHFFCPATMSGRHAWLVVPAEAAGVSVARSMVADTTRTLATVTLDNVSLDDCRVLSPCDPLATENRLLKTAAIALAADSLGGGNAVLAATIEYMKVRQQFGRLIGSFQALKHRVADHKAQLEAARVLVAFAARQAADDAGAVLAAITAKQHVTRVAAEVARDCIQLHGGVGFTSEYVPHIYLKRAKLNEVLFGTRTRLLDRIADLLEAA